MSRSQREGWDKLHKPGCVCKALEFFELARPPQYDKYVESDRDFVMARNSNYNGPRGKLSMTDCVPVHLRLKLPELKRLAKERGIKNVSTMKKMELIEKLSTF